MSNSRQSKIMKKAEIRQQPPSPTQDELFSGFNDSEIDRETKKDQTELELEKLVFGDDAGFREGLQSFGDDTPYSYEDGSERDVIPTEADTEEKDLDAVDDADLFFIDSGPSTNYAHNNTAAPSTELEGRLDPNDAPAWIDSDDERITVSLASNPRLRKLRITEAEDLVNGKEYTKRLRQQFERLYPVPEWANPSASKKPFRRKRRKLSDAASKSDTGSSADDMSVDSDDLSVQPLAKLLQLTDPLTQSSSTTLSTRKKLRPEVIDIQRIKDVGGAQPSAITSLSFHLSYPLLLSAGPASLLTIFHISLTAPTPNPTVTSLSIPSYPLTTALFAPTGSRIFFSARRRHFHIWDLASGRIAKISRVYGHAAEQRTMERFKLSPDGKWMGLVGSSRKGGGIINILDANTCQWAAQVRVEGRGGVADFAWWGDSEGLLVLGKGGEAVEYSIPEQRVVGRWMDEGAVGTTVVALGGKGKGSAGLGRDRWVVVGSQSGIVNVYDRGEWKAGGVPERPTPAKVLAQLTTPISFVEIAPDGQMFVMGSRLKRDALRLVHLPSCTVYKNWPTANTPLGRITAVAISPKSEMLAVANEQGKIRLWEIRS